MLVAFLCGLLALALIAIWHYFWLARLRRRVWNILGLIDLALAGEGHVTGMKALSSSIFFVTLQLAAQPFHGAAVRLELAPRHNPLKWLLFRLRKRSEMLVFQSDLELTPGFSFEGANERWSGRSRRGLDLGKGNWEFEQWSPCVISTNAHWSGEQTSVMNALFSSRNLELSRIAFQRHSPQFSATLPLDSLAQAAAQRPSFFDTLRELGSVASASRP